MDGGLQRLGRVATNFNKCDKSCVPVEWGDDELSLAAIGLDTHDQYLPAVGPKAELDSMKMHYAGALPREELSDAELKACHDAYMRDYVRSNTGWDQRRDVETWTEILSTLKRGASTGMNYSWLAKTNGDVLDDDEMRQFVVALAIQRAEALSLMCPAALEEKLRSDPTFLVRNNLADPVRVFIKNEIHPRRKAVINKWRHIASVSIVDRLTETLLVRNQDKAEIENWRKVPSKCGFGQTDADVAELVDFALLKGLNLSSDASGWDGTVPLTLLRLDAQRRVWLARDANTAWENAIKNVFLSSAYRLLATSDGNLYRRLVPGGQASGRKVTSSGNGAMRRAVDVVAGLHLGCDTQSMCMGDDCVTRWSGDEKEYVDFVQRRFGIKLTDIARMNQHFEFCSHLFDVERKIAYPCNPLKSLANLAQRIMSHEDVVQHVEQFENNLRHHPDREALIAVVDGMLERHCRSL